MPESQDDLIFAWKLAQMSENTLRAYNRVVTQADCDSADTILKLLPQWFADYNNIAPYSALGMKNPVE